MQDKSPRTKTLINKFIPSIINVTGLVVVILLIIGGALLAGKKWNPKWDPFEQKEIIIQSENQGFGNR
ncbi:MAG: hypothetical protein EXS52_01585 [Candidatus Staskawiczbacteria bacterium]|nr:hypothetical protein [Candidatus Staskawiczbacteria bacterium]